VETFLLVASVWGGEPRSGRFSTSPSLMRRKLNIWNVWTILPRRFPSLSFEVGSSSDSVFPMYSLVTRATELSNTLVSLSFNLRFALQALALTWGSLRFSASWPQTPLCAWTSNRRRQPDLEWSGRPNPGLSDPYHHRNRDSRETLRHQGPEPRVLVWRSLHLLLLQLVN